MTTPKPTEKPELTDVIDRVLQQMSDKPADSTEFAEMTDQLVKLHALKTSEGPKRVSPDVMATIAANLAGIIVVVGHERTHIITSKALAFIMKLR